MGGSREKPAPTRCDRLKTAAGVVGLSLSGPAFLSVWIAWIIDGRFPTTRGGGLTASENPFIFYVLALLGVAVLVPVALAGVMFLVGYALLRTSDADPAHAKRRRFLISLHGALKTLLRRWIALLQGFARRS